MENVLIGQFTGGFDDYSCQRAIGNGCGRLAVNSPMPPPLGSIYNSFTYAPTPPFHYTPYERLYSSLSFPLHLPYSYPVVTPAPHIRHMPAPAAASPTKHSSFPYHPSPPPQPSSAAIKGKAGEAVVMMRRRMGDCKRKKPRTPRLGEEAPRAPQRRKPLERATPLPPAPAVAEALDDLEREVTRGFVEDLLHALAPPPSSLPLPTFSLVRAKGTAASCAAV
uniref:Uncharacterized protein n=1 Tax=Leersia perrieri TaxID=77586 RepID=A0A0D9XHQ3_9ORYZ